jgi:hypothetical protein
MVTRTVGKVDTFEEAAKICAYWKTKAVDERISAAMYLIALFMVKM